MKRCEKDGEPSPQVYPTERQTASDGEQKADYENEREGETKEIVVSNIKHSQPHTHTHAHTHTDTHTHTQQRVMMITPIFLLCYCRADL